MNNQKTKIENVFKKNRLLAAFVISVVIALLGYILFMALKDEQQVLFSELSDNDAASIVQGLKELKVPYQISSDGKAISVESSQVHESRLSLMSKGILLNDTVGFELFDNTDYGMTEFAQKVNFQRALQGEIARTISGLEEISFARVHLTLPKNSIFANQKRPAKASVNIVKEDNHSISPEQVLGIQRLVAASVSELSAQEVVVIDDSGRDISVATSDNEMSSSLFVGNKILDKKLSFEQHLQSKVERILSKVLEPSQFAISVDVSFDYSKTSLISENLITPNDQDSGFISSQESNTNYTKRQGKERVKATNKDSETITTQYLYGKEVKQTQEFAGSIKRVSLAVILTSELTDDEMINLTNIISSAIGLNESRGDTIAVTKIKSKLIQSSSPAPEINLSESDLMVDQIANDPIANHTYSDLSPDIKLALAGLIAFTIFLLLGLAKYLHTRNTQRTRLLTEINSLITDNLLENKVAVTNG